MNSKQTQILRGLSPLPLYLVLGWSLGAWSLERRPDLPERPVRGLEISVAGEPFIGPGVGSVDLRHVPGVGRTRSRDLAEGLWERGWGTSELKSRPQLEQVAGIGPVTAGAVERWAASGAPGAYTGALEIDPAIASLPPITPRVHRKRATARPSARLTSRPAPHVP